MQGVLYELLFAPDRRPDLLLRRLESACVYLSPEHRTAFAATVAHMLPLYPLSPDLIASYLSLLLTLGPNMQDIDYFASLYHLCAYLTEAQFRVADTSQLLQASFAHSLQRLSRLSGSSFFSKCLPPALLRVALCAFSAYEKGRDSSGQSQIVGCLALLLEDNLLCIEDIGHLTTNETDIEAPDVAICPILRLLLYHPKVMQDSRRHSQLGVLLSRCKSLVQKNLTTVAEESKSCTKIISQQLVVYNKKVSYQPNTGSCSSTSVEQLRGSGDTIAPQSSSKTLQQSLFSIDTEGKADPSLSLDSHEWDDALETVVRRSRALTARSFSLDKAVAQHARAQQEMSLLIDSLRHVLTLDSQSENFPDFECLPFLPDKHPSSIRLVILKLDYMYNIYNILRLLGNQLSKVAQGRCRVTPAVCGSNELQDGRERFWIPHVICSRYNKQAKRPYFQLSIYVNNMILHYNGRLILKYFDFDQRIEAVCSYLNLWASSRGLINPSAGYFSLPALYLMAIFFLQTLSQPVADSIQEYCELKQAQPFPQEIPSLETLKQRPTYGQYKLYPKEKVRLMTVDTSFESVDVATMRDELGYPKNTQTVPELLTQLFHYFAYEQPAIVHKSKYCQMSVRRKRYVECGREMSVNLAYILEDPIAQDATVAYTVLKNSQEHWKILQEFRRTDRYIQEGRYTWTQP